MSKRTTLLFSGVIAGNLLLQSCATIISTPKQSVLVSGQPAGSTYFVNDKEVKAKSVAGADGAVRIRLPRKKNSELKVKHTGYKDYSEVLYPDRHNATAYLNWLPVLGTVGAYARGVGDSSNDGSSISPVLSYGWLLGIGGALIDQGSGANKRLNKSEVHPAMMALPQGIAGGQSVQCGLVNVRIKGGDKMGNLIIRDEPSDILYFGKSLDVDAEHLKSDVNASLKDLGFNVPATETRSVFTPGANSRYTIQGEMRDVKYDIYASHKYESMARFETRCNVEVTWKLLNQNRQVVAEHKTQGASVKFEKGGSAAFEDAFENSLYAFLAAKDLAVALAKPNGEATASTDKLSPIAVHRGAAAKAATENGVGTAAKSVVIVETPDGHGSGCIISPDGYIVTNAHVVGEQEQVKILLPEGITATGHIVRVNPEMDLALVKIDANNLTAFQVPAGSTTEIGADVFAIGTPADKELGQTVTKGIISARRKIEGHSFLQTDVSINGGNSGGALVARSGQLLGIVNAKLIGKGIEGIGFAIPAETITEALQLQFTD